MRVATATDPGHSLRPNEDWVAAAQGLIVVLDGATARTDTGCAHGVAWYAAKLGSTITGLAVENDRKLGDVLTDAIGITARMHPECDLRHPATPSATTALIRLTEDALQYLVLGDTTVVVDTTDGIEVFNDDRVDTTAQAERAEANRYPFGSAQKQAALLRMKHAELALRNQPGGFWVAAADPTVVTHAITGQIPLTAVRRLAVLTDGAARLVTMFDLLDWRGVLDVLDEHGPTELIRRVRAIEAADPNGTKWPRNKGSDDATAVYAN
ncbi:MULTISPECIES: protein phosphatase 2C domain-containing protein [unclassified Micromonospora]|uniref:protein phosphatase 2C domain-containing protein n=1 Tax=unclassified Micromonospora TaxID=2617518 RepID=UPI002FF27091